MAARATRPRSPPAQAISEQVPVRTRGVRGGRKHKAAVLAHSNTELLTFERRELYSAQPQAIRSKVAHYARDSSSKYAEKKDAVSALRVALARGIVKCSEEADRFIPLLSIFADSFARPQQYNDWRNNTSLLLRSNIIITNHGALKCVNRQEFSYCLALKKSLNTWINRNYVITKTCPISAIGLPEKSKTLSGDEAFVKEFTKLAHFESRNKRSQTLSISSRDRVNLSRRLYAYACAQIQAIKTRADSFAGRMICSQSHDRNLHCKEFLTVLPKPTFFASNVTFREEQLLRKSYDASRVLAMGPKELSVLDRNTIAILLVIGGVELNPGPPKNGPPTYQETKHGNNPGFADVARKKKENEKQAKNRTLKAGGGKGPRAQLQGAAVATSLANGMAETMGAVDAMKERVAELEGAEDGALSKAPVKNKPAKEEALPKYFHADLPHDDTKRYWLEDTNGPIGKNQLPQWTHRFTPYQIYHFIYANQLQRNVRMGPWSMWWDAFFVSACSLWRAPALYTSAALGLCGLARLVPWDLMQTVMRFARYCRTGNQALLRPVPADATWSRAVFSALKGPTIGCCLIFSASWVVSSHFARKKPIKSREVIEFPDELCDHICETNYPLYSSYVRLAGELGHVMLRSCQIGTPHTVVNFDRRPHTTSSVEARAAGEYASVETEKFASMNQCRETLWVHSGTMGLNFMSGHFDPREMLRNCNRTTFVEDVNLNALRANITPPAKWTREKVQSAITSTMMKVNNDAAVINTINHWAGRAISEASVKWHFANHFWEELQSSENANLW